MKAVVQRVSNASVSVSGEITGRIGFGLLVYLGVSAEDDASDAGWLAEKIPNLRIFDDADGKMNISLKDIAGGDSIGILAISQFTLLGDARKGRRPSWAKAAPPDKAQELYLHFMDKIRDQGLFCASGQFQAMMKVSYTNEGPVTILLDSKDNT